MARAQQQIDVILNYAVKNQKSLSQATAALDRMNEVQRRTNIANQGFFKTMRMGQQEWSNFNKQGGKFNSMGGRMANRIRMMTHGLRGFRMEMLGVMFFGMSLMRVFSGLTKTSMEWMGVTDIFSTALGILFLPIAEKVLEWGLKFLDWVDSLTESQKETIGKVVLLVGALGLLLTVVGTLSLGIGSVIQAFGGLFGTKLIGSVMRAGGLFKWISTVVAGIGSTFLIVAGIVAVVLLGIFLAWKSNFLNIRNNIQKFVEGFKQMFGGIIDVIKGIFKIIKGILTGDFSLVIEGLKKLFNGLFNFLVGGFKAAFNLVLTVIKGALKIVYNILKTIIDGVGWVVGKIGKLTGGSGAPAWKMPSFANGGIMPHTGLAMLHKGETVVPTGSGNNNNIDKYMPTPNIVVNASVSNDYDVRRLADQLKKYWTSDFERVSKGRTL